MYKQTLLHVVIILAIYKRSCFQVSHKEGALKSFADFTGKHLCWSLFSIKLLNRYSPNNLSVWPTEHSNGIGKCYTQVQQKLAFKN